MGGINHQPCSTYLPTSTRLSRAISRATVHLHEANIVLEDVIIGELANNPSLVGLGKSIVCIDDSINEIVEAQKMVNDLRTQMTTCGYSDLPTLHAYDLPALGQELASAGVVNETAWNTVTGIMTKNGFHGVLDAFDWRLAQLKDKTGKLKSAFQVLAGVSNMSITEMLEMNKSGTIKPQFATLLTDWLDFTNLFLASSILSTQLWYGHKGYGAIIDVPAAQLMAVV